MATIKSYTDLSQSKTLSKILPLESADMCYMYLGTDGKKYQDIPICAPAMEGDLCAWSLAALLGVIPKHIIDSNVLRIDINENSFAIWYDEIGYGVNNKLPDIETIEPIDACVSMIEKLNELNLL